LVIDRAAEGSGSGEGGGDIEEFLPGENALDLGAIEGVTDVSDAVEFEAFHQAIFQGVDFLGLGEEGAGVGLSGGNGQCLCHRSSEFGGGEGGQVLTQTGPFE
jgi:hypothetical protein